MAPKVIDELKKKYSKKLDASLRGEKPAGINSKESSEKEFISREYSVFKKENLPGHLNIYEMLCNWSEKIFKIEADAKKTPEIEDAIKTCHLDVTSAGVTSFSLLAPIILALTLIFFTYIIPVLIFSKGSMFFVIFGVMSGLAIVIPLQKLPFFLANNWRMKASNEMVLAVFYIVTYMRHTSNLERAITFAAEHLDPPLSFDMKKIIWDVESENFDSVKESLEDYLKGWQKTSMEFVESMHLIESSLYESTESRRLDALDKSLNVILDETYEKMLHYAHNLKGPITALHMLGIILPILGLVILPLMVSFMPEVKWYHLMTLYNVVLPISVFYLARNILSTRPTGYGESDISETNKGLRKFRKILIPIGKTEFEISPLVVSLIIFALMFFIGILPLIIHAIAPGFDVVITNEGVSAINNWVHPQGRFYLLGYREEVLKGASTGNYIGPYGLGATILSLILVASFGIGAGLYYHFRSRNVIKIRDQSKALEKEFASALFQLGNRIGDGLPAEIAFGKVAEIMEGTLSGKFFELVAINISKLGMSIDQAIFDEKKGALVYYPSNLIESSMKVLVESSKKGPMVASQALINVSEYIKQIHRVDERLKDLMADIITNMRSQIKFLTPAIAGIVVGITSMITQILGNLSLKLSSLSSQAEGANVSGAGLMGMFGTGIPTFYFQFAVGLYVIQITFIISILINGIENGSDKLSERFMIGKNLLGTTITYGLITLVITLLFTLVAGSILSSFSGPGM